MVATFISHWPGKSSCDGKPAHPAAYHMLDVAAVADQIIVPEPFSIELKKALTALVCLHDLGKMTPDFKGMILNGRPQHHSHWEWTEVLLRHHDSVVAKALGADRRTRHVLYAAVAGHHGRPPSGQADSLARLARRVDPAALLDTEVFIDAVFQLYPGASLAGLDLASAKRLSWWIAGLTSAADWVGSNADWFPAHAAGPSLEQYMSGTRGRAAEALVAAGLDPKPAQNTALFGFAPRQMQTACAEVPLPDGPTLAVIEDETGAGKTEAALLLAQRMLLAGKGRGVFMALPTMATADAMFTRACSVMGRMFDHPSVALAHGRSALSEAFRAIQGQARTEADISCAPWLADGRRRALLAQVGVGTVDQALLGVLPTRFATLRLWGLASKVLIVDEVHEIGDPYMSVSLERLLEYLASQGGSAILLTATLPLDQKARLIAAFAKGRGAEVADRTAAYPLLTVAGDSVETSKVHAMPSVRGAIAVRRINTAEDAIHHLVAQSGKGAACVWVRNSVDDAIAAAEALEQNGVPVDLLHARFALSDRKTHEAAMLDRFGKSGNDRAGRVLVATQVVESSLDLDFDVMVSDLAPMAALIQRAGRLWRHMGLRPTQKRPVIHPVLSVLSPDPDLVTHERWLHSVLGGGAWTYAQSDCWRTARALFHAGRIDAPHGLRALVEAVHGASCEPVPPHLERLEFEAEGADMAKRNLGWQNAVDLSAGYRKAGAGHEDTRYPTRLGAEQRVLVLARMGADGNLRPWAGEVGVEGWMLSEVQASARKLDRLALPDQTRGSIAETRKGWPAWQTASWNNNGQTVYARTLCAVDEDGTICPGLRYDSVRGLLFAS